MNNLFLVEDILQNILLSLGGSPPKPHQPIDIQENEIYKRFRTLWSLSDPDPKVSYPLKQPKNAWLVYKNKSDMYFKSIYYQSTERSKFRDRIFWAIIGPARISSTRKVLGENFCSLRSHSSEMVELHHAYNTIDHSSPLDRARLARVFGYLGFFNEAVSLVSIPWDKELWSEEDSILSYTNLFLSYTDGGGNYFFENCRKAFSKMPSSTSMLRTKLTLAILCGGYCGKLKQKEQVAYWRNTGEVLLSKIEKCPQFADEEVALLKSRWWRFACFLPFLNGNSDQLDKESTHYEILARKVGHSNDRSRENMYAVLETKARIEEYKGNLSNALLSFLELSGHIDPHSAKAWINLGDIYEKMHDYNNAILAFQKAALLGPPLRDLAYFRSGVVLLRSNHLEEALCAQAQSLQSYPLGLAPLVHIAIISKKLGLTNVHIKAEKILSLLSPRMNSNQRSILSKYVANG